VDPASWRKEVAEMRTYLEQYGSRLPAELVEELKVTEGRLA
jgi:GTP-dependent phosphoenolpyruvate carboxykinase